LRRADLGAAIARIEERQGAHTQILADIQTNAKATNGRVTKLERAWWYARGFAGAVTIAITVLGATGHLHIH
jgi:hypothetical protein